MLEMSYFEPVGTNIYGTHNCGYSKFGSTFAVLKHFILFFPLKFWAVKICGLQICWYSKYVGIQNCR